VATTEGTKIEGEGSQLTLNHVRSEVKEPGSPNALPIPSERGDAGRRFIVHADENGLRVYRAKNGQNNIDLRSSEAAVLNFLWGGA
jgi:hypothetical protein